MSLHSNPVTHSISILIESMFLSVSNGSHKLQFNLGKFADFVFQGSGTGSFNWTSVAEAAKAIPESFNLVNPPMRGLFSSNIPNLLLRRLILDISRYFYNTPCFSRPKLVGNSLSCTKSRGLLAPLSSRSASDGRNGIDEQLDF
ncbi:uncharacterized protein ACHE_70281S [Aspergillus chevalieri]|uniref:Uncharacterized protein n=1 Tax=Aspergillus chevalieri TaxID=182096 RepID=A0A7R7VV95_ASPCH|nr:uncharacterized protein ACHE_70281S [Aspergillus chevalieri]BCR91438.1 hypothetical protein ACHE_70281S [Aspergillus chevalieri]